MKNIGCLIVFMISIATNSFATGTDPIPLGSDHGPIRILAGLPEGATMYPNPATDYIFLVAENENTHFNHLLIQDMNGKTIKEWPLPNVMPHIRLDTYDLPPGMYLVQIHTKGAIYHAKIFKARR
jgi:hypothetical protein